MAESRDLGEEAGRFGTAEAPGDRVPEGLSRIPARPGALLPEFDRPGVEDELLEPAATEPKPAERAAAREADSRLSQAIARAEHVEGFLRELEGRVQLAQDRVLAAADAASESERASKEAAERAAAEVAQADGAAAKTAERLERLAEETEASRSGLEQRLEAISRQLDELSRRVERVEQRPPPEPPRTETTVPAAAEPAANAQPARPEPSPPVQRAPEGPPIELAPARLAARPEPESLDINGASFEDLRAFGLSVNQTARLLAQREQRGGFTDVSQFEDLYGFPRDLIDKLKLSARI